MKLHVSVRTTRIAGRQSDGAADLAIVPALFEDGPAVIRSDRERPLALVHREGECVAVQLEPIAFVGNPAGLFSVGALDEHGRVPRRLLVEPQAQAEYLRRYEGDSAAHGPSVGRVHFEGDTAVNLGA